MPPLPRPVQQQQRCVTGAGMAKKPDEPNSPTQPQAAPQPQQQQQPQQPQQQGMPPGMQRLTPQQQQFLMQQMYAQQVAGYRAQQQAASGFGAQYVPRAKNRNSGQNTDEEWDAGVEKHDAAEGRSFRRWLIAFIVLTCVLLGFAKADMESGMDLPPELLKLAQRDAEIRGDKKTTTTTTSSSAPAADFAAATPLDEAAIKAKEQEEESYRLLNVEGRLSDTVTDEQRKRAEESLKGQKFEGEEAVRAMREAEDRIRRLDDFRVKQKIKQNFEQHLEQYGQLVHCGKECNEHHQQLQLAYDTLNSKVSRELIGTLTDENVAETGSLFVDPQQLKEARDKKLEEVNSDTTIDDEIKSMEIAEINDAFEILSNPDGRNFYRLYGRKPPDSMKHTSTRHGGWGADLLLRTHKNRLVLAWLDYFEAAWADWTVLCIIGLLGFVIPAAVQLPKIIELAQQIEEQQTRMEEMEKRVARGESATAPPEPPAPEAAAAPQQ